MLVLRFVSCNTVRGLTGGSWRTLSYSPSLRRLLIYTPSPISYNHVIRSHPKLRPLSPSPLSPVTRYTSSSSSESKEGDKKKVTKRQESRNNLVRILREYGTVATVFHLSMSLSVLGVCYMVVKSGVDVNNFLKYFNIDASRYSMASTFAVSYIIYKILLPLRATITITCVPFIVRYLRGRGWMKPVPKKPPEKPSNA